MIKLKRTERGLNYVYKNKRKKKNFFVAKILSSYIVFGGVFFIAMIVTLFAVTMGAPAHQSEADTRTRLRFGLNNVISITSAQNELNWELTPSAIGTFIHGSATITVATNNPSGYSLMISTNSQTNALSAPGSAEGIVALASPATITDANNASFSANSWGYTTENNLGKGDNSSTVFKPVPTIGAPDLARKTSGLKATTTDVTFGIKATSDLQPGIYSNTILFTAIANVVPDTGEDTRTLFDIYYMQDMTDQICANTTTPSKTATALDTNGSKSGDTNYVPSTELVDKRDKNVYTVRKLADGNCWMADNLRLVGSKTLMSSDSDVSSDFTLPATQTTAFTDTVDNNQVGAVNSSYGNGAYYSWYAATAGTGTAAMSTNGQDATSSVCPKGWRLPPYSGNKSYQNLLTTTYGITSDAAGSTALQAQPLQFVLAGYYNTSGFVYGGSVGYYWSSSVYNASYAYDLSFSSSVVNPQGVNDKYYGYSVRCVARDDPPENTSALTQALANAGASFEKAADGKPYYTMQSMTSSICGAVSTPAKTVTNVPETTLIDTRDKELYTVRKLADGNCWMSQNLRLKLTANTPLTSADTDVTSNFTPTLSTQPTSENTTSWGSYNTASDVNKSRSYDTGNKDYGTYYNWFTATAGTGLYNNTTTNATGSICPKNWQLPLNTGTKSYYNIITTTYGLASSAEGSTVLQSAPLSFPLSGYYSYSGSVRYQGSHGFFWSATPYSSAYRAYILSFSSSSINPQGGDDKALGISVRCVVR